MQNATTPVTSVAKAGDKAPKARALAVKPAAELAEFNPRDPQTLLATAKQLAQFVTENKLASTIQGRSYVQAEGWQFLFAVAGLDVICDKPTRLREGRPDTEICYEAAARLFDAQGREVGYGAALCSTSEGSKRTWAEYAILSMAQTRAIGKAGRNRFAFVMKAAGFEPTPAEEMSEVGTGASVVAEVPTKPVAEASAPASAPLAACTGAAPSIAGPSEIPAEVLAKLTRQMEALTSGLDLQAFWLKLTKAEKAALFDAKEHKKEALAAASEQAVAQASRQNPGVLKVAGEDSALVDEFTEQPVVPGRGPAVEYATGEQREAIERLLNHPLITRREKTKLLLSINKLDRERARQALLKLRSAIAEREGVDPREGVRAQLRNLVAREGQKLPADYAAQLLAVAESPESELAELVDIHEQVEDWLLNEEVYGTDAELAAAEADDHLPTAA